MQGPLTRYDVILFLATTVSRRETYIYRSNDSHAADGSARQQCYIRVSVLCCVIRSSDEQPFASYI